MSLGLLSQKGRKVPGIYAGLCYGRSLAGGVADMRRAVRPRYDATRMSNRICRCNVREVRVSLGRKTKV